MYEENSKTRLTEEYFNNVGAKAAEQLEEFVDCRPCSRLLNLTSLKAISLLRNDTILLLEMERLLKWTLLIGFIID